MNHETISNALAKVRVIYAELAKRPIQRHCSARTECYQVHLTGQTPPLTNGDGPRKISAAGADALEALERQQKTIAEFCQPN